MAQEFPNVPKTTRNGWKSGPKPTPNPPKSSGRSGSLGSWVMGLKVPSHLQNSRIYSVYPRFKVPPHLQNSRTGLDWDGIRSIPTQTKIPGFPTLNPAIPKDKIPGWNSWNSHPVDGQLLLPLGQDPVLGSSGRGFDIPGWNSGPAVPGTVPGPPLPLGNSLGSVGQQGHAWEKGEIRDKPGEKQGKN